MAKAAKTLVVASSEVHKRRVELLVPCLKAAVARGVDVQATFPDPEEAKPKKVQAIADAAALLKQVGARVSFREACPNLVVADSATVWYGGIAPFAYLRADDQVLRFISGEVARELEGWCRWTRKRTKMEQGFELSCTLGFLFGSRAMPLFRCCLNRYSMDILPEGIRGRLASFGNVCEISKGETNLLLTLF